tara:strand:- start:134 stop:337 length:204 start_codon:yes stop_codon:yes gene_type:complete
MKAKRKTKRKIHKTSDPTWDTHTYGNPQKSPFDIETIKVYNPMEGKDMIVHLYKEKKTGKIVKWKAT